MRAAILRRLILVVLTVAIGSFISAMLARYAPGFGTDERQLDPRLSHASVTAILRQSQQQRNIVYYYFNYLGAMLHGDLGTSRSLNRPVKELLAERGAVTAAMVGKGLCLAWLGALIFSFLTAWLRTSLVSIPASLASGVLLCLPAAVMALLSVMLGMPGYLAITLILFPKIHAYLRNLMSATAQMPHIITARAKGASELRVLLWHVLPVIDREIFALAGVSVSIALSAAIPVEALCGIPGLGQLAWQSALGRDIPVLIVIAMLVIACVALANSGADSLSDGRRQPA
jgi:peptide/nickel transport system permease protein